MGFARYLGVLLDENLSFLKHIQAVELKLSRNLGIIRKLKHVFLQKNPSSTLQRTSETSPAVLCHNLADNLQITPEET